jgi:hypothetical protein
VDRSAEAEQCLNCCRLLGVFAARGGTMAAEGVNGGDDGMMRIGKRCYVSNLAWKTRYRRSRWRPAALACETVDTTVGPKTTSYNITSIFSIAFGAGRPRSSAVCPYLLLLFAAGRTSRTSSGSAARWCTPTSLAVTMVSSSGGLSLQLRAHTSSEQIANALPGSPGQWQE